MLMEIMHDCLTKAYVHSISVGKESYEAPREARKHFHENS